MICTVIGEVIVPGGGVERQFRWYFVENRATDGFALD